MPGAAGQQLMLQAMIEGMETGVMVFSDNTLRYANGGFKALLGYDDSDTISGMLITDLISECDQEVAAQRRQAVASGQSIPDGWLKLKMKNGALVHVTLNMSRVLWNGQPHFITAVSHAAAEDVLELAARKNSTAYERFLVAELEKQQSDMARDLHDSLGSELAAVSLMLGCIKSLYAKDRALGNRIDEVLSQVQVTAEMARGMARGLMPVDAYAGGFLRAMEKLASDWTLKGIDCRLLVQGSFEHVLTETGTHVYRIAQEAVTNAVRHGGATSVRMFLGVSLSDNTLVIEDNGSGFDAERISTGQQTGLGLRSMMARSRTIGGRIEFARTGLTGSRIFVAWPGDYYKARDLLLRPTF